MAQTPQQTIEVDFGVSIDPPLVKKFGVMNSGLVPMERYRRDYPLLHDVKPESLRIDMGMGWPQAGWTQDIVTGTPDQLRYHFAELDELANMLNGEGVLPYWSYCYVPTPIQRNGSHINPPTDLDAWKEILRAMAAHFRESHLPIGYHEIYNEPDLSGVFFTGLVDRYLPMYKYGVEGIRAGDPDAVVGGPALAYQRSWIEPFLDYVEQNDLPLDFFSFHVIYPASTGPQWDTAQKRVEGMRRYFADRPGLLTTEFHINEFHPFTQRDTTYGGAADRYLAATQIFEDIRYFVDQPDVTLVHWAQFMSSIEGAGDVAMGLVDLQGHKRASYNAFEIYARLPIERRLVTAPEGLGVLASANAARAGVVIWNRDDKAVDFQLALQNLPFSSGRVRIYAIDAIHSSRTDNPQSESLEITREFPLNATNTTLSSTIEARGLTYIEFEPAVLTPVQIIPVGEVVRLHHYYPNRGASTYAEFDRHPLTAYLGMGEAGDGYALVGAILANLPDTLALEIITEGNFQDRDRNSLLGVRIDFPETSVLFHNGSHHQERDAAVPWGTGRQADQVVQWSGVNPLLPLAQFAPVSWDHRATLSFILQNTGARTRAKITLRPA